MPLTMRPTETSPVNKGRVDFTAYCGAWAVGRIYEHLEGPEHLRWFWALNGMFGRPREIRDHGHAPTLDEAKAQFEAAWRQWLAGAKLGASVGRAFHGCGRAIAPPRTGMGLRCGQPFNFLDLTCCNRWSVTP
jgi:hypothetical protein